MSPVVTDVPFAPKSIAERDRHVRFVPNSDEVRRSVLLGHHARYIIIR